MQTIERLTEEQAQIAAEYRRYLAEDGKAGRTVESYLCDVGNRNSFNNAFKRIKRRWTTDS
ncbi:MAG: hypothetical protein A4E55_02343 [Pelotomaculum sp. PtaU1.Bin035]|nr:MAG: hypothetical protein A4E55_02343 [Pelotomaculum sp. PtaU1.Bin035]